MTGNNDVDIITGKATNNPVEYPGGSLLVVHGLGKGCRVGKPILEC